MESIEFLGDDNEKIKFYIIEQTRINNVNYILVTENEEDDDEESEAYIMKDVSKEDEKEASYVFVEEDKEIDAVGKIFAEMLEDIDIEK